MQADDSVWSRVLAVSPAYGDSVNGKIVHLEQRGEPTQMEPNRLPARSGHLRVGNACAGLP